MRYFIITIFCAFILILSCNKKVKDKEDRQSVRDERRTERADN